ncbi:MAG: TonB-dependent receptor plug domain-containing protein [Terriglobales bacterium]
MRAVYVLLVVAICVFSTIHACAQDPKTNCSKNDTASSDTCGKKQKIEPGKESVVVTGTFAPVPTNEIDRSVAVIDTRENSLLFNRWTDYLELDPSVDLQQRAADGVQADLSIRGSTFAQTLVLLNGLRMNDVQSSHHDMDLPLPTDSLERIEILRGAGSTFYGSDAVGGTINFITGPPAYSEFRVGSAIGNFGTNQESVSADMVGDKLDEQLSAARDFSSGFRPDRDYRSLTIFSNTGAQSDLGRTLVMLGYGDKPFGADQFYGNFNSWERTKSWFAGLKQDLGDKTEFDLGYRRHTDEFVLIRDNPSVYENNHIDESWQAALRRKESLGQNSTLFYGGEGFHESIVSNNLGNHARSHGAVYADYDVRAWRRLSFSAGAREEIFDTGDSEFAPTVAAGYWIKSGWKLKASASRAFRLPTYTDLYYSDPANVGNPNLKPETAWSYEGGLVWDQGGRYKAEVTVFERHEKNDIDYVRGVSSSGPYQATNINSINFTGVETSFGMRLPRSQEIDFSYTGLYGAQQALNGLQSKYIFNYPVADAVVAWQGKLPGKLIARSRIGVASRYSSDPYGVWDADIGREFEHARAHLAFSNLSDTHYEEVRGVIMPGRSVIFGIDLFVRKKGR